MDSYNLPLLAQGLPVRSIATGTRLVNEERVQTDRGDVYMIRPCYLDGFIVLADVSVPTYAGALVTLRAGGQGLLIDSIIDNWGAQVDRGADVDQLIRVDLSDAQTFEETIDFSTAGVNVVNVTYQTVLYYTNPAHDRFLQSFKWGSGLGLKRRTYVGSISAGPAPTGLFAVVGDTIPTGNGNVIGVQLQFYPLVAVNGFTLTLIVNGVAIIQDVSANYFNVLSQINPQFFRVLLQPGSTFALLANSGGTVPGVEFRASVTFFFEN